MKKALILIALAGWSGAVSAQKIKVSEGKVRLSSGSQNGMTVTIHEASVEDVEKAWKSLMKGYKAKVSGSGDIFADNALIKSISDNTLDIYARAESKDGAVLLSVAIDMGGAYMNSSQHSTEYKVMERIVYDFAVKTTKEAIAGMLKEERKAQERLEKEQESLVKSNERLHGDIEKYKQEIEKLKESIKKAEGDIEQNKKDQETKKAEVEKQKKVVAEIEAKEKAVN